MSRCAGFCCERFHLPLNWDALQLKAASKRDQDLKQVAEMVIPLPGSMSGVGIDQPGTEGTWYGCKNFDQVTRTCTIYEARPHMCRVYGENGQCEYELCPMNELPPIRLVEFIRAVNEK